jgi:hypothetical protein
MVLPNFLIIGTPKAGTTAVYKYLDRHPEIYFSSIKEPHFFSFIGEQKPHWGVKTLAEYEQLFAEVKNEKAIGEASTWYLYSQTAAEQIKQHIPHAKLIIMLRNPIDRAYSSWAFRVQCGWESIANFERALAMESDRIKNNYEWDFHYLQSGFYAEQIGRYLKLFSRNQIHICLYEDFRSNPSAAIHNIFNFLEVDCTFKPDTSVKHNVTYLPKNTLVNSLFSNRSNLKRSIKALIPESLRNLVITKIRQNNQLQLPPLSPQIKQQYISLYREDILKTAKLIDRDISQWLAVN